MPFLTFTGLSPCVVLLPKSFNFVFALLCRSYNPGVAVTTPVWASTRSLATTCVITIVFSSSAYLDVSVQQVCAIATYLQYVRLPHSDICGSRPICESPQLFAAYHVLLRLWEPQASPIRPYFAYCTCYLLSNHLDNSCSFYFLNVFFISICQRSSSLIS